MNFRFRESVAQPKIMRLLLTLSVESSKNPKDEGSVIHAIE